jgi:hypothetical protein
VENLRDLVLKIHATPHKVVLAITGGGAEAIGELLRHGQGSSTLLEAVVPYDQNAFDKFVRGKPDKYCSRGAANDLAMAAYQRGLSLAENCPVLGVGVTCSLTKDNERVGRHHHAYVAFQSDDSTYTFEVELEDCQRTRNEQEALVATAIIQALATQCGISSPIYNNINGESVGLSSEYIEVVKGQRDVTPSFLERRGRVIFPGAFNPFHHQHERICEVVVEMTNSRVDLEVCIRNVDKPALSYATIAERRHSILEAIGEKHWIGELFFTGTPTFAKKVVAFPESTFVLGWDTYIRICDPKYGSVKEAVSLFKQHGAKFIVFDRLVNGVSLRDSSTAVIPVELLEISTMIDKDRFSLIEVSSTEIRNKK